MKMNERQSKSFPESEAEISGIGKEQYCPMHRAWQFRRD